jgi:hypothetical protein
VCADSVGGTIDSAASSTRLKGFADGRGVTEQGPQEGLRTSLLAPRARQLSCPPRLLPFEVLAGERDEPSVLGLSVPFAVCPWQPLAGPWSKHSSECGRNRRPIRIRASSCLVLKTAQQAQHRNFFTGQVSAELGYSVFIYARSSYAQ